MLLFCPQSISVVSPSRQRQRGLWIAAGYASRWSARTRRRTSESGRWGPHAWAPEQEHERASAACAALGVDVHNLRSSAAYSDDEQHHGASSAIPAMYFPSPDLLWASAVRSAFRVRARRSPAHRLKNKKGHSMSHPSYRPRALRFSAWALARCSPCRARFLEMQGHSPRYLHLHRNSRCQARAEESGRAELLPTPARFTSGQRRHLMCPRSLQPEAN